MKISKQVTASIANIASSMGTKASQLTHSSFIVACSMMRLFYNILVDAEFV